MTENKSNTEFQNWKAQRDRQLYIDFISLMDTPGAKASSVTSTLMYKYSIHSASTIWKIRKEQEALLKEIATSKINGQENETN